MMSKAAETLKSDPTNTPASVTAAVASYKNSWGIRGDNTPETARYLGYLDARELYPDIKPRSFTSYIDEVLQGKARAVYAGMQ